MSRKPKRIDMEEQKRKASGPSGYCRLLFYADFETQVLTILNRAEYEEEMIDAIAEFLCQVILKGCGLRD